MTVVDFVRLTRVNAKIIFALFSIGLLIAFVYTLRQPVIYTATSKGYVVVNSNASVGDVYSAQTLAQSKLGTYASLVSNTQVAEDVIAQLKLDATPAEIAGRYSAVASGDTPQLTVFATAGSPEEARDLADAAIGALSRAATRLETAARAQGASAQSLIKLEPFEQASLPGAPSSPSYPTNLGVGAIAGILMGYVVGLVRRQLDTRVRTVDDLEVLLSTSSLSIVPEARELDREHGDGLLRSQTGAAAEALRQLRTNLRFVDVDNPPRSIVVTSANAGEGKSAITANLARVLAAAGQRTVLLDGDLRRPEIASIFGLDPTVGLTQLLAGDVGIAEAVQDSRVPNLAIVTSGRVPPNPSELLGSQRMASVVADFADRGFLVLIDAPPLLPVTDAGLLSGTVDGTILVLAVGRTYKEQARVAAKVLSQVGGHLVGAVLNRAPAHGMGSVVYGYGHGYYSRDYYNAYHYQGGSSRRRGGRRAPREDPKRDSRSARGRTEQTAAPGPASRPHVGAGSPAVRGGGDQADGAATPPAIRPFTDRG